MASASLSVTSQWRPRRAFQIVNSPSTLFVHSSKPCNFHDSISVMMRMLPVRAWCPRYRPTCSFGSIPLAASLATGRTDSPHSATSFFQARPERRISAVKPSVPILKKLIALGVNCLLFSVLQAQYFLQLLDNSPVLQASTHSFLHPIHFILSFRLRVVNNRSFFPVRFQIFKVLLLNRSSLSASFVPDKYQVNLKLGLIAVIS